jgi:hypothetical protein
MKQLTMRPLMKWALFLAVPLLLVLSLSASAGTGPATGTAKTVKPRTLATQTGDIQSFVQDKNAIAWIDSGYKVHVQRLSKPGRWVVGWAAPFGIRAEEAPAPSLALAGTRALWTSYGGGMSIEEPISTGAPGDRPLQPGHRATNVGGTTHDSELPNGTYLGGLAGDGSTLVYGFVWESCAGVACNPIDVTDGGVREVLGQRALPPVAGIPAPVMLAVSQGWVAVVPAQTSVQNSESVPRAPENGPVEVYDLAGKRLARVVPAGTVEAVALTWPQLAVLVRRHEGTKAIERYDARTGALLTATTVSSKVSEISMGTRGIAYSAGSSIYLLAGSKPTLVWRSTGAPIGVSIEGRRIAWAVNGRPSLIRAVRLP